MKVNVLLGLCFAGVVILVVGCGNDHDDHAAAPKGPGAVATIAQKMCPVMLGNAINPEIYVDHDGRRIYFCCMMCPPKFKADPAKYLKIVDEDLKKAAPAPAEGHEGHTH